MFEIGAINLRESGDNCQIFSSRKLECLASAIAKEAVKIGVNHSNVNRLGSQAPFPWSIPPIVTGKFGWTHCIISPHADIRLPLEIIGQGRLMKTLLKMVEDVASNGYNTQAQTLVQIVGPTAYDERVFNLTDRIKNKNRRVAIFVVNLVTAFLKSHPFVNSGDNFYVEDGGIRFGIVDGCAYVAGKVYPLRLKNLRELLYEDRGILIADPCKLDLVSWAVKSSEASEEAKTRIIKGISTLKFMAGSYDVGSSLLKEIYLASTVGERKVAYDKLVEMYSYENLEKIRDVWLDYSNTPRERYKNLYDYLVPNFIDEEKWGSIFRTFPSKLRQCVSDNDLEFRVNENMEAFIMYFISTKNKLERSNAENYGKKTDSFHRKGWRG